jgi:hypothetical protein
MRKKESAAAAASSDAAQLTALDLDHVGCIVNTFAKGAAQWERLGFQLTPVSRQRGAVPGHESFHPWATANRCVILRDTYLELIGVVDAAAFNPWARFLAKNEGLHILALRSQNAQSAYARLSARTDALLSPVVRERVLDVDGEPRTMRFRNIFSRDEIWPEARYLVIEHQTPEFLWQPRFQQHANGAIDLVAVTFVADDPVSLKPRLAAFGATIVREDDAVISAELPGRGSINIMCNAQFSKTYGYAPSTGLQSITVSFHDLAQTLDFFKSRGVGIANSRDGAWIAAHDANGFVIHLVQDNGVS